MSGIVFKRQGKREVFPDAIFVIPAFSDDNIIRAVVIRENFIHPLCLIKRKPD